MTLERAVRPATDELIDLDAWVHWLADHYDIWSNVIPDCWEAHGHILEELTALHRAWLAAYSHDARADAPLHWHEALAHAQRRLREWCGGISCRFETHRQPEPRDWITGEFEEPTRH